MFYELSITETARNAPQLDIDENRVFNKTVESFQTVEQVNEFLEDRYNKIPTGKNKIYRDQKNSEPKVVGFLHSFWNKDWSHNSKSWWQTDWITINKVNKTPFLLAN